MQLNSTEFNNATSLEVAPKEICQENRLCDRCTHEINFLDANVTEARGFYSKQPKQ
jgi:hypothetical protein